MQALESFAPDCVIDHVVSTSLSRAKAKARHMEKKAWSETEYCAVALADISGFTPLTAKCAAMGDEGLEALSRILNQYFGRSRRWPQSSGPRGPSLLRSPCECHSHCTPTPHLPDTPPNSPPAHSAVFSRHHQER